MMASRLASILILASLTFEANCHVALTFPPARKYDLDFLDSVRTKIPCGGMPKGDIVTTIPNGQQLTVTWHLGYAHGGGFKLQLLDPNEKTLKDLTTNFVTDDKFAVSHVIDLDNDLECKGCSIRLVRQATEWKDYQFMSCADVDIVPAAQYQTDCLGNGTPSGSSCICDSKHYGDRCQFTQDCATDFDCQNGGKCIENPGTALPKRECYCPIGFFGRYCSKVSDLKERSFNESNYKLEDLRADFKFYWRLLGQNDNTLEGVMVARTTSYVAVGWRDEDTPPNCQTYPTDVGSPSIPKQLHPMDCQDIVVGKARDSFSNVGDFYTQSRSTPRRDEVYGGKDDLTAAAGWEENGYTYIMFRKPVDAAEDADNSFESHLELIYAYGQANQDFYKEDELKYHGGNRGHKAILGRTGYSSAGSTQAFAPFILLILLCLH